MVWELHSLLTTRARRTATSGRSGNLRLTKELKFECLEERRLLANLAPLVSAGADAVVELSSVLMLTGSANDDGLPNLSSVLTTNWRMLTGPGVATFADPSATKTTARFDQIGTYVLQLQANDGELTTSDSLVVTVTPPFNLPPTVDAGTGGTVVITSAFDLYGTASDDTLPQSPGVLTTAWRQLSGPGVVVFGQATSVQTTVRFSQVGTYVLQLQASDGVVTSSDEVTVKVLAEPGLIGYWSFEEGRGNQSSDHSGAGHNAVLVGPNWTADGRQGQALELDGNDDYIDTGSWDISSNSLTIAAWFKADDFGPLNDGRIISKSLTSSEQDHYWMISSALDLRDGQVKLRFRLKTGNTTTTLFANTGSALQAGEWTHVAAVYDGSQMRIYQNGVAVGATAKNGLVAKNPNVAVRIGSNADGSKSFDGVLDEVRVYDRALTAQQVEAIYRSAPPLNQPPVVTAGPGGTINVASQYGLTGTISDDGLPTLPGKVTAAWSKISGPGSVQFVDASSINTLVSFSQAGSYVLQLQASDGKLTGSDRLTILVNPPLNQPPVVTVGPGGTVDFATQYALTGTVSDDGLPTLPGNVTAAWSKISGPGSVQFVDASSINTQVSFSQAGSYVLQLQATDGALVANDRLTVVVNPPVNQPPVVTAGPGGSTSVASAFALTGTVSDDGLPTLPGKIITAWSKISGPGNVQFVDASSINTQVSFSQAGSYVLQLRATDGELVAGDMLTVVVNAVLNQAPLVDAGPDGTVTVAAQYALTGTVSDDGLPASPGKVTATWSKLSGPGSVQFANASAANTLVSFSQVGSYVLQLQASDGLATSSDTVTVNVLAEPGLVGFWSFEEGSGTRSADLSGAGHDALLQGATWVDSGRLGKALEFNGTNAFLDTGAWDISSSSLTLSAWFRADDFGPLNDGRIISKSLSTSEQDHFWMVSSGLDLRDGQVKLRFRLKTAGVTTTLFANTGNVLQAGQWTHVAAVYDGSMMRIYQNGIEVAATPKSGAISTNPKVAVRIGSNADGSRPFDGMLDEVRIYNRALSSQQIVAMVAAAPPTNRAPLVNAGLDGSTALATHYVLDGTVSDDGLPNLPGKVTTSWSKLSGPGDALFADATAIDTTVRFTQAGTYVLQLQGNDGALVATDTATVVVTDPQQLSGFFVSTSGTPTGNGSFENPWDLKTAMKQPAAVKPGATIWLRGGTYRGGFESKLTGTAEAPITVRAYPGERVTIDTYDGQPVTNLVAQRYVVSYGNYTTFWGLEIMNSDPQSRISAYPAGKGVDQTRGLILINGSHNKLINMVIHDLMMGVNFFADGAGGEIYGSIIYNNGYLGSDGKPWNHGIYAQNSLSTKHIVDNFIFNNFNMGLHIYSEGTQQLTGFEIEGNTLFNNGAAVGQGYIPRNDIIIGGLNMPAKNVSLSDNYVYQNGRKGIVELGYYWGTNGNQNLSLSDNYIAGELQFNAEWIPTIAATGNTVVGRVVTNKLGQAPATGITTVNSPVGSKVSVQPNIYEPGRAAITIFNWDLSPTVGVDLSQVLSVGANFEIHHAYDLFGAPVLSGTYQGGLIQVPLKSVTAPRPIGGQLLKTPVALGPEFGAFVVTSLTLPGNSPTSPLSPQSSYSPLLSPTTLAVAPGANFEMIAGGSHWTNIDWGTTTSGTEPTNSNSLKSQLASSALQPRASQSLVVSKKGQAFDFNDQYSNAPHSSESHSKLSASPGGSHKLELDVLEAVFADWADDNG